jgi:ABC-type branched-subunit amino acid transport system ATPase component
LIEHDMKLVMSICERITVLITAKRFAWERRSRCSAIRKVIEAYLGSGCSLLLFCYLHGRVR